MRWMRTRLLRWQLWVGLILGGYLLVRAVLDRAWIWVVFATVALVLHVYREATRPLLDPDAQDVRTNT